MRDRRTVEHTCPFKGCDYRTLQRANLTKHIDRHRGIKQFNCTRCAYETHDKASLVRHCEKIHKKGRSSRYNPISCASRPRHSDPEPQQLIRNEDLLSFDLSAPVQEFFAPNVMAPFDQDFSAFQHQLDSAPWVYNELLTMPVTVPQYTNMVQPHGLTPEQIAYNLAVAQAPRYATQEIPSYESTPSPASSNSSFYSDASSSAPMTPLGGMSPMASVPALDGLSPIDMYSTLPSCGVVETFMSGLNIYEPVPEMSLLLGEEYNNFNF